jgi:hypothetical protein
MAAGEGGGVASSARSGRQIFSFLLLFWFHILDLAGDG